MLCQDSEQAAWWYRYTERKQKKLCRRNDQQRAAFDRIRLACLQKARGRFSGPAANMPLLLRTTGRPRRLYALVGKQAKAVKLAEIRYRSKSKARVDTVLLCLQNWQITAGLSAWSFVAGQGQLDKKSLMKVKQEDKERQQESPSEKQECLLALIEIYFVKRRSSVSEEKNSADSCSVSYEDSQHVILMCLVLGPILPHNSNWIAGGLFRFSF